MFLILTEKYNIDSEEKWNSLQLLLPVVPGHCPVIRWSLAGKSRVDSDSLSLFWALGRHWVWTIPVSGIRKTNYLELSQYNKLRNIDKVTGMV